jgi:drug/metabolite transporter (DMT)-like permease
LGSYQFLGERLRASQWGGLGLSFAGVALAIGVPQPDVDAKVLLGDLLVVGGGALWAATTLMVKATLRCCGPRPKRRWATRWRYRSRFWGLRPGFRAKP